MHLNMLIEGWILETTLLGSRILWMVRGYTHPDEYIVVTPYAIEGRRVKQYDWSWLPSCVKEFIPCIGRIAPLIAQRDVVRIVDPERALRLRRGDLPAEILELLDILNPEWAGLTGSWAVFGERLSSDVDVLVYGNPNAMYKTLLELREEGRIKPCMVEDRYLKVLDRMSWSTYAKLLPFKTLDSCYRGKPYTIRILRRLYSRPCYDFIVKVGVYEGMLRVVDNSESHLTPARYIVDINGNKVTMETWHTRYMELPKGVYKGYLEVFHAREGLILSPDIVGYLEGPL